MQQTAVSLITSSLDEGHSDTVQTVVYQLHFYMTHYIVHIIILSYHIISHKYARYLYLCLFSASYLYC